jgi:hypothetical protein
MEVRSTKELLQLHVLKKKKKKKRGLLAIYTAELSKNPERT